MTIVQDLRRLLTRPMFEGRASKLTGTTPSNTTDWASTYSGTSTTAGQAITEKTALQVSAVWACVNVLAENVASLPWMLYETTDTGKRRVTDRKLASVLHDSPNIEQTSYSFRHAVMVNALLWGNGFAEIVKTGGGEVTGLIPIRAERVELERFNGVLRYRVRTDGAEDQVLLSEEMFHLPGLSFAGVFGTNTVTAMREVIGLAAALDSNAGAYFGNGSRPGGILKFPAQLSDVATKRLRESWERIHQGAGSSQKTAVIEEGGEFQPLSETNEASQHLESRQFQVTEICRIFRVPPHMVADLTRATFSNIEHSSLEFVTQSLRPWLVRWEQEAKRKLLVRSNEHNLFTEFKVEGLLRGDLQSRYDAYATARSWGWMSANDVRDLENQNRIENGDIYLQPLNMVEAGTSPEPVASGAMRGLEPEIRKAPRGEMEQRSLNARSNLQQRFLDLFAAQIGVIVTKESRALMVALKKALKSGSRDDLRRWMEEFFDQSHMDWSRSQVIEVYRTYVGLIMTEAATEIGSELSQARADEIASDYATRWASQHVGIGFAQIDAALRSAIDDETLYAQLEIQAQEWHDKRSGKAAMIASAALGSLATVEAYRDGGVTRLVWRNVGENCDLCSSMDGRTVEISKPFLSPGDKVEGGENQETLEVKSVMNHPPLHAGCNCVVTPG